MNGVAIAVAMIICFPAVYFAATRSTWMIDYLLAVAAFNRGIRRVVDYYNGAFDPYSPISLTPLVVGGLAAVVILQKLQEKSIRGDAGKVVKWYVTACTLAFIVGLVIAKVGAIYELGNYMAPLGLLGYGAAYGASRKTMQRWGTSAALVGLGVAVYGLYQFYTIPPWDAFWLRAVNFVGYMGIPEPTRMTLFSTMHERGPAASFLCGSLILIALRPRLIGALRWPAAATVFYAMLLTYSRTILIQAGLAAAAFPVVSRGKGIVSMVAVMALLGVFGESLLSFTPVGDVISNRYATLSNVSEDGSFKGRMIILGYAVQAAISQPWGIGFGSHGLATRIAGNDGGGMGDSTGYIEILRTFGWVGTGFVVAMLVKMWKCSTIALRYLPRDPDVALFRAWFVAGMIALFSGNWLFGASYFWVLAGAVLAKKDSLIIPRRPLMSPTAPATGFAIGPGIR